MKLENKVRLLSGLFLTAFFLIFLKLVFVQVISAEKYSALAEGQHFYTLEVPARRGEIRAADNFPLASNKESFLFYVNLTQFSGNKEEIAEKLSQILSTSVPVIATDGAEITPEARMDYLKKLNDDLKSSLIDKLNNSVSVWVNLAHFVSVDQKKQIEDLNISGLGFESETSRDYPESSMSAHVLGFVGFDAVGNPQGYFGLEGKYERELSGKSGEVRIEKDALGRPIAIGSETRRDKLDGRNLVTTLDRSVQKFTEKSLLAGISNWKATGGTAIVMEAKTGAILAMASFPNYELGKFSYYPTNTYKNPAIANLYEPGSIIKPLVMAAAINEGKVTPQTKCDNCSGPREIGDYFIHTFNDEYHPNLTMTEVLINSDNTGMVFVGEKLGYDKLYSYFQNLGFGKKTNIDLQEEEEGSLRSFGDLYPIDKATLTFGQGIGINAMQMMKAWSALANGGKIVTPHVVSKIVDGDKIIDLKWNEEKRVFSADTSRALTQMLVRVAKESPVHFPLDRVSELKNFQIAAKSGTAEISVGGKYEKQGTIASVIGYFPAANPRFLVMVKLNSPEVRPWGSDTAGPVFAAITRDLLYYYGVSP